MTAPNVVGLDLSVSRTGIAWADGSTSHTKVPGKVKGGERLARLMEQIEPALLGGIIGPASPRPHLLVLEDYAPGSVGILGKLTNAELHGCVLLLAAQYGIPVAKVRPSALKLYATGNGQAEKAAMIATAVEAGGDMGPKEDDRADAFWLRQMGLTAITGADTAERVAVADGVTWPAVAWTPGGGR